MPRIITEELRQLVAENEHITKVHFDENGGHHFNAYPEEIVVRNDKGEMILNAARKPMTKKTGKTVAGGGKKYIVETLTREAILDRKEVDENPAAEELRNTVNKNQGGGI